MITLATLSQATAQEVFDQVSHHLLTQRRKSIRNFKCVFRTKDKACAAGCLMTDAEAKALKHINASWDFFVDQKLVPEAHKDLIMELQEIHDQQSVRWWEMYLDQIAYDHGLKLTKPTQTI